MLLVMGAMLAVAHLLIAVPCFWCASVKAKSLVRVAAGYVVYCLVLGPLDCPGPERDLRTAVQR